MPKPAIVTKHNLIDYLADETGMTKAAAARAVDAIIQKTTDTLSKGGAVQIMGFGTFGVSQRTARQGTNPSTGKKMEIPARNTPKFTAGTSLKRAVNAA